MVYKLLIKKIVSVLISKVNMSSDFRHVYFILFE